MRSATMIAALSLLFVTAACGEKKDGADKSAGTETEKPATDKPADKTTTKPADKPVEDKTGAAASDDDKSLCESRCQLLTRYSLAELEAGKHKEICGTEMRTSKCQHFDYLRNCIYAHNGYKFKKKKWQKVFGKADWYKQRDDFKDSDLSKMQLSNVRELKDRAAACRSKGFTKVSAEHGKMIRAWFKKKKAGKPELPKKLFVDHSESDEKSFLSFLNTEQLYILKDYTPIEYVDVYPGAEQDLGFKPAKIISVSTGMPGPDCKGDGEECEGFEWIEFYLDGKGKIVALNVTAAACPFVYAAAGPGPLVKQGEILRFLSRPDREATQSLSLDLGAQTCASPVRVKLAEEKNEITYLDSVALSIGGDRIAPRACAKDNAPFCTDDGAHLMLHEGEALDLTFDLPAGASCEGMRIVANGHYVPLP